MLECAFLAIFENLKNHREMDNKLQELTDKLYKEGLSKGKEEGEALLAQARQEADGILDAARKEAETILKNARKEAEDYRTKVEGDVKMAASQSLQATRKDIENLIIGKVVDEPVTSALSSAEFVKEIIRTVAGKFNPDEAAGLDVVLPESLKAQLEPFIKGEAASLLKGGIDATFSKKVSGGFNIGPKDGSWFVSFTDGTFKELVGEYLRPATRKILFGEDR